MAISSAIAFSALLSVAFAGLLIIEAGTDGKMGPKLENGFKFCPEDFSSRGFSIECRLPEGNTYAAITVNGKTKYEGTVPYHAAGDVGNRVVPLSVPSGPIKVMCKGSTGVTYTAQGMIGCDMMMVTPSPIMEMEMMTPTPMVEMEIMTPTPMITAEEYPAMPTPSMSSMPTSSPMPTPSSTSMPTYLPSTSAMPSSLPSSSAMPSSSPTPSMEMMAEAPKDVVPKKDESPQEEEPPSMEVMPPSDGSYCVTKKGDDIEGSLPPGWTAEGTALTFRKGDGFGGTVKPKEGETLEYKFTVPYKGTYAFVLDMTTSGKSEHNDVWVRCDGGWTLRRFNGSVKEGNGFTKAYHNKGGRAQMANTVDFDAHQFSTKKVLMPGQTYTIEIAGRSTKTTINGIILFPCKGEECQQSSKVWKAGLDKCSV